MAPLTPLATPLLQYHVITRNVTVSLYFIIKENTGNIIIRPTYF